MHVCTKHATACWLSVLSQPTYFPICTARAIKSKIRSPYMGEINGKITMGNHSHPPPPITMLVIAMDARCTRSVICQHCNGGGGGGRETWIHFWFWLAVAFPLRSITHVIDRRMRMIWIPRGLSHLFLQISFVVILRFPFISPIYGQGSRCLHSKKWQKQL